MRRLSCSCACDAELLHVIMRCALAELGGIMPGQPVRGLLVPHMLYMWGIAAKLNLQLVMDRPAQNSPALLCMQLLHSL